MAFSGVWYKLCGTSTIASMLLLGLSHDGLTSWKEDWKRTVEAARKEGRLTLYGDNQITHPDIIRAFNKEFPTIKVVTVSGKTELQLRITAERRAGKYLVDALAGGPGMALRMYFSKFLEPISPTLMLPEVTDKSKWYGGKHHYKDPQGRYLFMFEGAVINTGLSYNTKFVNPDELKSYWDLLDPRWRGKITAMDMRARPNTTAVMLYYDPKVGPKFFKRLFGEMDVRLFRNRTQGTDWLARGRHPICFGCRGIERLIRQGLPVSRLPADNFSKTEGMVGSGASSVIVSFKKAPHPNAAKVFINWYLSRKGQMGYQDLMNIKIMESSDSMRIDIPKDKVLPDSARVKGRKYGVLPYQDPLRVQKFLKEILKK